MRRRTGRLVDDRHPEADPLLDRSVLGAGSVLRIRRFMEDDEIAHPRTRAAIIPTIASGVFSPESITKSKDRKSTRLNSSHLVISYAVFCLKKKNRTRTIV